ncbi:hypothetical protein [Singulisphaera sp. PoT]|uniref:hypothetical protein n=1 Tax=Singulisphaera sp. PoT TaxID=3411797 RepID=UPI003BF48BB4
MPPRLVSLGILLYWAIAASTLIRRDVLPEMGFVRPPDLRTIARAEDNAEPSRWSVEVIDNPLSPDLRRSVGTASTHSTRNARGWVIMKSRVFFDAGGLLKGTPLRSNADGHIEVLSSYQVDPSGNLRSFQATVKAESEPEILLQVDGALKKGEMEITSTGPMFNRKWTIPYQARGLIQNAVGPFDRLPNLQVGQRWETRVISPLFGNVETVRVEVARRTVIQWNNNPVPTYEVVHHMTPLSARTWVRPDGFVLRQEVPLPFVKLVLERLPDHASNPNTEVSK